MELNFCIIDGLPSVRTAFGDISVTQLKENYTRSTDVPTHVVTMYDNDTAESGKIGIIAKVSTNGNQFDAHRANQLIDGHLTELLIKVMKGTPWVYNPISHSFNQLPLFHQFGSSIPSRVNAQAFRLYSDPGATHESGLRVALHNGVEFRTESQLYPAYRFAPSVGEQFGGTVKVLGKKTRFLFTSAISAARLDQDAFVQEVKNVLGVSLPGIEVVTDFDFYVDLETASEPPSKIIEVPPLHALLWPETPAETD